MTVSDDNQLTDQKPLEDLTYAQAFSQLETIVAALEAGDHSLEESLALFERGKILASYCANLLEKAELKIQQISEESFQSFLLQ